MPPAALVVCEGIHALHEHPRAHLDLSVFVDAPREVRWARWEAIERAGERGMGVEKARIHFDSIAEPTFAGVGAAYRQIAHILVRNDAIAPGHAD